jgi:hypothetical protein
MRTERLLSLTASEVASRARQELSKWLERVHPWAGGHVSSADLDRQVRALADGPGPDGAGLKLLAPADIADRLDAAERLLAGRFDLLGYRDLHFGDPIDWHLDPVSSRRAPLVHWSRLDPLAFQRVGDAKVTWELNRHQWLVTLAQAYALSGDERYAEALVGHLDAWLSANPLGQGINWSSSLEVALRLIAWCWVLRLARRSPALPALLPRLVRALSAHAGRVERYLSYTFSPNTHLLGEALGLCYAGATLGALAPAARWRALGARVLATELGRQVSRDGLHFEQATCYHRYTVEIYLHWLRLTGGAVPPGVAERVQAMLDCLLALRRPDGTMPGMGDADGGWLLPLATRRPDDVRGVFAAAATMFRRADYAWAAGGPAPEVLWLYGARGAAVFEALAPRPPVAPPSRMLAAGEDGGAWAVLRADWDARAHQVLFDAAPLGCPASSAHGHADLLAVQASFFGEPIVVDPGTFTYAERSWRDHFRSSAAHSTVTIDGRSQAEPDGPFSWRRRPAARLGRWQSEASFDVVSGWHAAYASPDEEIVHRRTVIYWKPRRFVLVDDLRGAAEHRIDVRFCLAPGAWVERRGPWARILGAGGAGVDIGAFAPGAPLELRLEEGWVAPDYGQRVRAPIVVFSARARLPLRIVTHLVPRAMPCVESPAS